jgi:polyhydroxyalkanoate synthase subunit PhaE
MDPFAYAKSIADMWTAGGKAFLSAQEAATKAMSSAVGGAPAGLWAADTDLASSMADLAGVSQSVVDLWSAATTLSQALSRNLPKGGVDDPTVAATFKKMADPRSWLSVTGEMDEVLGRMTEGARFSDLWDVERKYARVARAWLTARQRALEQAAVVLEAWQRAARLFGEELAKPVETQRTSDETLRLWTETANKVLLEMQRSEAFLEAQARMIRASTELRQAQHELVEYYGERFGFPTRRELDDVHKAVTELRREVRAARRAATVSAPAKSPALSAVPTEDSLPPVRKTQARKPKSAAHAPQPVARKARH